MSHDDVKCHTEFARWERFQQAAHLEKQWMNERLNWMLVPQGVLFAALGLIVKESNVIPCAQDKTEQLMNLAAMVSTLGITLALIGFVGAVAAGRMHFLWTTEVNKIEKTLKKEGKSHLVTFGMKPHWPARTTSVMPAVVAVAFFLTWAAFICNYKCFDTNIVLSIVVLLLTASLLVAIVIGCIIWRGNKKLGGVDMVIKAVFFDVDGVLLNTLPAHIQVCVDLAKKEKLNLAIPTTNEFKNKIIRKNTVVAPMRCFFEAVGFDGKKLDKAVSWYNDHFSDKYELPCFDNVEPMLADLAKILPLGIVTSNVRKNIEKPLGRVFKHFTPGCVFTEEMGLSKPAALVLGASYLGLKTEEIFFVGDQERDREAAEAVGAHFLGVTYGWQFKVGDEGSNLVDAPDEIVTYIKSINMKSKD